MSIARPRARYPDTDDVLDSRLGEWGSFRDYVSELTRPGAPSDPKHPVWFFDFGRDNSPFHSQGMWVFVDAVDGHVITVLGWVE